MAACREQGTLRLIARGLVHPGPWITPSTPKPCAIGASKRMKRFSMFVLAIVAIAASGLMSPEQVQARMPYFNAFKAEYTKLDGAKVDETKCGICHGGEKGANKKKLSKYATELKGALGKSNVKDEAEIKKALKAVEAKDAGDGKTYGDLLKEGKFPAAAE